MGAFICQVSEVDWLVSREIGVYGNREGSETDKGIVYFTNTKKGDQIIQSIIEDLIGMVKGDTVFFHVIKGEEESSIHGVYRVREEPFYNAKLTIWKSSPYFVYPYRFCFEPHPDHIELCRYDANIPVSEFYRSVEYRNIISVLTLEREVRGAAHAVKKILHEDAEEIIKLLYRDFPIHGFQKPVTFKPMQMTMEPLREHVERVGEIEFAIKALAAYKLGRRDKDLIDYIPACKNGDYDFVIETFVGQTMRKPIDIMCVGYSKLKSVSIVEAKTGKAYIDDLVQALKYQEIFKLRNLDKNSLTYKFSICLLAQSFHQELVEYASLRNKVLLWEEVVLLKYTPTDDGKNATFALEALTERAVSTSFETFTEIPSNELLAQVSSDPKKFYTIFNRNATPKIDLVLKSSKINSVILQKIYKGGQKDVLIGNILIYNVGAKCYLKDFTDFMKLVYEEANKFKGDFMMVEPIIVAENYDGLIRSFIEKYNNYEKLAHRQPIGAYITRTDGRPKNPRNDL